MKKDKSRVTDPAVKLEIILQLKATPLVNQVRDLMPNEKFKDFKKEMKKRGLA